MFMPDGILRKLREKASAIKARKPMRIPARKIAKLATSLKKNLKSNLNGKLASDLTHKLKNKLAQKPARKTAQNTAQNTAKNTAQNTKRKSVQKPVRKPIRKPVSKLANKPARKPSRNNMSTARRRMYFRRRIAVGTALLLILAIVIFCVISLGKGLVAIGGAIAGHEVNISRKAVPDPRPVGLTPRCSARNIRLELSTSSQTVPMGGSVEITERFVYDGNSSCLIDASNINAVLTVNTSDEATKNQDGAQKNSDDQSKDSQNQNDSADTKDASKNSDPLADAVWRSDECKNAPLKPLLMSKGDHFEKKITWNTNANSGKDCTADEDLPKVDRGIYVIQLQHKRVPGLHSDPLLINVK